MKLTALIFFSLSTLALAQTPSPSPTPDPAAPTKPEPASLIPPGVKVEQNIAIGSGTARPIWINIAYPVKTPATPMPAMIWVHGGAWVGGDAVPNKAIFLAAHGYFTASVDYRKAYEAKWPAQIEDCRLAVRWLRANAAKYNVNLQQIACWGESAGGHLVCCMGILDDPKLDGDRGYPGVSSKVQAVVDFCGPNDLRRNLTETEFVGWLLFPKGTPRTSPKVEEACPILHVKPGNPPFLVVHGDRDDHVSYEKQALPFVEALKKANVPVELYTVQGGYHAMAQFPNKGPTPQETEMLHKVVLTFLDKQFKHTEN